MAIVIVVNFKNKSEKFGMTIVILVNFKNKSDKFGMTIVRSFLISLPQFLTYGPA